MKKLTKAIVIILTLALSLSAFVSCNKGKDKNTIVVGASSTPHAEILEQCKDALAKKGYKLEIRVMSDYVTPNTATEDGEIDANFFQHTPYLEDFNKNKNTHLVSVAKVHYELFGLYKGKTKSLEELADGAIIAIPNDGSNEARALFLLEAQGLIKLKDGVGMTATKADIAENPHNFDIKELEASLIPGMLDEVDVAVINGNYALEAKLKVSDALAVESGDSEAAKLYANVLVVKQGNENNEAIKALVEVLKSEAIVEYIKNTYNGAVVAYKD